jgi:hypothetical protein
MCDLYVDRKCHSGLQVISDGGLYCREGDAKECECLSSKLLNWLTAQRAIINATVKISGMRLEENVYFYGLLSTLDIWTAAEVLLIRIPTY